MGKLVNARLDEETERALKELQESSGMNESQLIREAIRLLRASGVISAEKNPRVIFGLGKFTSGEKDLASNKKHLAGFGHD